METADELFGVPEVMSRYSLRDRRAARRIMDEAGSFKIGVHLYVRRGDLVAYEEAQKMVRAAGRRGVADSTIRARAPRPRGREPRREPLAPGWWRS